MVKIGDIYLGGAEGSNDQRIYNSGIGFFLTTDSKINNTSSFENGKWNVELKKGQQSIVARCTDVLSEDQILDFGLKYCQEAIDFLSIEYAEYLNIQELGNFHILLYNKDNKFILKQVQTTSIIYETTSQIIRKDINGNIVPEPAEPEPKWTPALRFFRLAQNTNDLYEAYKNAYLCFEFLLNKIFSYDKYKNMQKSLKQNYSERQWIINVLKDADSKYQLIKYEYIPRGKTDTIEEFVNSQYDIRCKLFHAKGDQCLSNIIIPADTFNPIEVSNSYEKLMVLLKKILLEYCNIKFERGIVTYNGFKSVMESNLNNGYCLFINADDSPINGNLIETFSLTKEQLENENQTLDKKIWNITSPKKIEYDLLSNLQHDTNFPGMITISGEINKKELDKIRLIYRTSLLFIYKIYGSLELKVFYNKDGLYLSGIDKFESNINIKLKNK